LPPSARLIIKVLKSGNLLTQKEIINRTDLPARTVRYALSRLKNENILQQRFCFQDARQSLYGLNSQALEVITA
jgi:predicted transcriptional regulator